MADIDVLLRRLGLSQYESAFRDNDIDEEVLFDLTADDLIGLGVSSIGHRRKLLAAIAGLRSGPPASPALSSEVETSALVSGLLSKRSEAERRQLTVMFADLVDSTELSARMDPEDMREVIISYQNAVAGEVTRFEGHVAKYMGDGVVCYFGWPKAHEDDAERAVRAALCVTKAVSSMKAPGAEALAARVGIATGLVVVGDLIGKGAVQEEAVIGDTPNLAARLQALAVPGQVVVSDSTRRLFGDTFELADLGRHQLKGITGQISAFGVINERSVESRFEARASGVVSGMVGRELELALVLQRWNLAKAGEGQLVLLSGEAGIGKSRVARAVVDSLNKDAHIRISYQCSPFHTDSPLFPIIQHLSFCAGITSVDSNDEKLDKLESVLVGTETDRALIAALIGVEHESRPLAMTPQQQRAHMLQALVRLLIAQSSKDPVLVVLEDAHWIDATTLEFINLCLDQVAASQILILVTARPTFHAGFGGHPIVTALTLNRLGREPTAAIVNALTGGKSLPAAVLDEIADKTDGVPLFVEELTKMVLESGDLRETPTGYELTTALGHLLIPATLHASLMARLDRLQPVKEVAQTAACIGREFQYGLLKAISSLDHTELQAALDRLISAELIFGRGLAPEATYVFKHALVRDAAYESLLKSRRQLIHAKLVDALEKENTAAPEVLAHHATVAGMTEKAIGYWRQAGIAATARPAYQEAIGHLTAALSLVHSRGEDRTSLETELDLQVLLAYALIPKAGYSAEPTARAFERGLKLIELIGDSPNRFPVLFGNWAVHHMRGESLVHLEQAKKILKLAEQQEDDAPRLVALRLAGVSYFAVADLDTARRDLDLSMSFYRPAEHSQLVKQFGLEPGITTLCFLYIVCWLLGFPDQADTYARTAERAADETKHVNTTANTSFLLSAFALCTCDEPLLERHSSRLQAISKDHDLVTYRSFADLALGTLMVLRGRTDGIDQFKKGFSKHAVMGVRMFMPNYVIGHARALLGFGNIAGARDQVSVAQQLLSSTGQRWAEAEIHRVNGHVHLAEGNPKAGMVCYRNAIKVAREQKARSLELRASVSLARHLADSGNRYEARDVLAPIYDRFTEGSETPDLKDARVLLDALAAPATSNRTVSVA